MLTDIYIAYKTNESQMPISHPKVFTRERDAREYWIDVIERDNLSPKGKWLTGINEVNPQWVHDNICCQDSSGNDVFINIFRESIKVNLEFNIN